MQFLRFCSSSVLSLRNAFLYSLPLFFLFAACTAQVSFQVQRPAQLFVDNVEFVTVDSFVGREGNISFPSSKSRAQGKNKAVLRPYLTRFSSDKNEATQSADLLRAMLLGSLSSHAPYRILNTTGKAQAASGILPDPSKVAVLHAQVKYVEARYEKGEKIPYVMSIHNKGTTLEQQLLAKAGAFAVRSLGGGFKEQTPYVEQIGAMEVTFELTRKNNGEAIIPPQTFRSYFVKKWGGNADTSHLSQSQKQHIEKQYQQDQGLVSQFSSKIDRVSLALEDPHAYLSKGYNLKQDDRVPQTSLDLKIRLGLDIVSQYLKQMTPYEESVSLDIQAGNPTAVLLIQGNAYEEAIAYLQGLSQPLPEDLYNLGLAYEATGQPTQAKRVYGEALQADSGNALFQDTVQRLKKR